MAIKPGQMSAYLEATQIAGFSADEARRRLPVPGTPSDFTITLAPEKQPLPI